MGGPIGFLDNGDATGLMRAVHKIFYVQSTSGYIPGQMRFVQWPIVRAVGALLGRGGGAAQGFKTFREWSRQQVRARTSEDPGASSLRERDLLDHFISMREPDGSRATEDSVMGEIGNLIGAGADTAAIGIAVVLGKLVENPDDLAALRREIDGAYRDLGSLSSPSGEEGGSERHLSYRDMEKKLPFLVACVQEATRLCPSILWQLPREAPEAGITIAGYYIPPGATLGMSPIAHNRSTEIFGDDADEWRPQRWLPSEGVDINGEATKTERQRIMDKYNVTVSTTAQIPGQSSLTLS
jgi:cytochrome P450